MKASAYHPTLQKTKLGWILAGRLNNPSSFSQCITSLCASVNNSELNERLHKFWVIDDIHNDSKNQTREERCEEHFTKTTFKNDQDRYVVELPLKQESIDNLGGSRDIAFKRLQALERHFDRDPVLNENYSKFMHEYIALGHMQPIVERTLKEKGAYYMLHHYVAREVKSTRLRVVFDASCKTDNGMSLNDAVMIGLVIQDDLTSILLRFRTHHFVLVADIIKMYRQVLMHPSQTRLQRILWRNDKASDVQAFELITVTYGTAAASYFSTRCLFDLAEQHARISSRGLTLEAQFLCKRRSTSGS